MRQRVNLTIQSYRSYSCYTQPDDELKQANKKATAPMGQSLYTIVAKVAF